MDVVISGDRRLEAVYEEGAADRRTRGGVVVAHPHPLQGGTMTQPLVYRVAQACCEEGLASLRFNFRGVGKSDGVHSGCDEYRDVTAALADLRARLGETVSPAQSGEASSAGLNDDVASRLGLIGYSFGAIMSAHAAAGPVAARALTLIGLPAYWEEQAPAAVEGLRTFSGPILAVCGELDDIAPPEMVAEGLARLSVDYRLEVIPGVGHLFEGRGKEVGLLVAKFMAQELAAS